MERETPTSTSAPVKTSTSAAPANAEPDRASAPVKTSTPVTTTEATKIEAAKGEAARAANAVFRAAVRKRLKADQNGVLIAASIMAGGGWVLLYRLINGSPPLAFPRWLFFILFYLATTGTAIPFVWYLNQRFSRRRMVSGGTILREGMWVGLFMVTASWLLMTRALTSVSAFFLALSITVIETFLRLRERQS